MVKRILCTTSALALALSLSACGDSGSTPPPAGTSGSTAVDSSRSVGVATKAQADKLISDAGDYIKANKWELADTAIKQLEEMKPKLPPEYGPRIDQLRKSFDAAKAGGGVTLPKF